MVVPLSAPLCHSTAAMTDKPTLRQELRAARRDYLAAITPADRARAFRVLPSPMTPLFADRPTVAGYAAIGEECDVTELLELIAERGCPLALPWFADRAAPMRFKAWMPGAPLAPAPFGGGQPADDAPDVDPQLLLVPLIGFDRGGNRLGQGGGHYDRALARLPGATRIGIAWSAQEAETLPADPWDLVLDHILTEREWITPMKATP